MDDETRYRILRRLTEEPTLSQRALAREFEFSLGKINYCFKALLEKGYIKAGNFKHSTNKRAYMYQLTPKGIAAKSMAAQRFLKRKQEEYERLAAEIETLQREVKEVSH